MQYKGYDVLLEEPNRIESESVRVSLSADVLDNLTGKTDVDVNAETPLLLRSFLFFLDGRDRIFDFKQWLSDRKGRRNAFWAPSWQADFQPLGAITASTQFDVQKSQYPSRMFPHTARRYLVFIEPDHAMEIREVTAAAELSDRDRLTLDSVVTTTDHVMVSYLVFYRLASDDTVVQYHTPDYAECELEFLELPREVP